MNKSLSPNCVYTIRHTRKLSAAVASGGSGKFTEGQRWKTGHDLWKQARQNQQLFPILFGPADANNIGGIIYWALIDHITLRPHDTTIRFSALQPLAKNRPLLSLTKLLTSEPLSDKHIHGYVLCRTPAFLRAAAASTTPTAPVPDIKANGMAISAPRVMRTFDRAQQLLGPRETGLFVFTDGLNFAIKPNRSGSTGFWRISPHRQVDRVVVFRQRLRDSQRFVELFTARPNGLVGPTEHGKFTVKLLDVRLAGSTDRSWQEFVGAGRKEFRYVSCGKDATQYWVIKAKPAWNDNFRKFPIRGKVGRWYTGKPLPDWAKGDTLFIWAAAPTCRMIGVASLVAPDDGFKEGFHHFRVRYLSNPVEGPTIAQLRRVRGFRSASFLKPGPSGTVFPLTPGQGSVLQGMLLLTLNPGVATDQVASKKEENFVASRHGAGFGTTEKDIRRVETAGIAAAKKHLKREGWQIKSVEHLKRGYDLDCKQGPRRLYVEVKGVRGSEPAFIITSSEYRRAMTDPSFALCVVTRALCGPKVQLVPQSELPQRLKAQPLAFKARLVPAA